MIHFIFRDEDQENGYFDCCNFIIEDSKHRKRQKRISIEDLIRVLKRNIRKETHFREIGELPKGYVNMKLGDERCLEAEILLSIPEGIHRVQYENSIFHIPMPNLVFSIRVLENGTQKTRVFCRKKADSIKVGMPMYFWPFGNVGYQNTVCWGGNSIRKITSIKDVEFLPILFFDAPMNSDYYHANRTTLKKETLRELLMFLDGKEKFPEEFLVRDTTFQWNV